MKLVDAIIETDKLRNMQYPSGKVLKYAMRYVRQNKQLFMQAVVASGSQKGVTYQVRLVFNGILSSDKRTRQCTMKYKDLDGSIYFIQKPTSEHHILTRCSCFTGDTLIPLADGYSVPIKDLVGRKEFYVYSFDLEKNKPVIGKGHSAKSYGKDKIIKLTLDNGEVIKCTEDHLFLLRDGTYKMACELTTEDSLMALYRDIEKAEYMGGYEVVYNPLNGDKEFTHWLSADFNDKYRQSESWMRYDKDSNKTTFKVPDSLDNHKPVRHHKDYNKLNNSPLNIAYMFYKEHWDYHSMHQSPSQIEAWNNYIHSEENMYRMKYNNPMQNPEVQKRVVNTSRSRGHYDTCYKHFYNDEGKHIATELVEQGKHHFQTEEHKERARQKNLNLSSKGIHPFQIAAKEGRLWTQKPENKDKVSRLNSRTMKNTMKTMNPETKYRRNAGRGGRLDKTLDWFNALPLGKHIFKPKDVIYGEQYENGCNVDVFSVSKTVNELTNKSNEFIETGKKSSKLYTIIKRENLACNHKVVSIEDCGYEEVYCLTVDDYHNFAIDVDKGKLQSSGVFVHNCPDFRFMWHWWLGDKKALLGPRIPYQRKTTHYPEKNPDHIPGIDKHILTFIKKLISIRMLKADQKVKTYLARPKKSIDRFAKMTRRK
jgi:intein/homing endonuclease